MRLSGLYAPRGRRRAHPGTILAIVIGDGVAKSVLDEKPALKTGLLTQYLSIGAARVAPEPRLLYRVPRRWLAGWSRQEHQRENRRTICGPAASRSSAGQPRLSALSAIASPSPSPRSAAPAPVELAFEHLAVTRHEEAETEIDRCGEQIGLDREALPIGIGRRGIGGVEQVKQPDDQDERGVLESGDEIVDWRAARR
jgi:hypothetical protein